MLRLLAWQGIVLSFLLMAAAVLLVVWWRQQSLRWWIVLSTSLIAAPALSWWSGVAFQVADYRAGCDGLCPGSSGAPIPFYQGEAAGGDLSIGGFLLNSLVYLVLFLAWAALVRTAAHRIDDAMSPASPRRAWITTRTLGVVLFVAPLALSPMFLPPPEARVRGDSQRVAINAQREVYLYDQLADLPVLRVGLADVRPRLDGETGMRVCLRIYTFFYLPTGSMYLDMTPEGVHSNHGGVAPRTESCWG